MKFKVSIQDSNRSRRILPGIVTRQQGQDQIQQIPELLNPKLIPITIFGRDYIPKPQIKEAKKWHGQ